MLHADDDGFVRAPAGAVYPVLTDVAGWPTWWPGTRVDDLGDDRSRVTLRGGARRLRLTLAAGGWRHDEGVRLTLSGDLVGEAEFWLEPGWGGTVVHHLLTAEARRAPRASLRTYRRWLRRGLWALRDHAHAVAAEV